MPELTCPSCGGHPAMHLEKIIRHQARGYDLTRSDDCYHPCHAAAQRVVDAAVTLALDLDLDPLDSLVIEKRIEFRAAVAGLLKTLEENDAHA
jgi:hypothetical protein